MQLIYILFLLLVLAISSEAQNPLEELLSVKGFEIRRKFFTSKFPVEYLDKNDKNDLCRFEAGVLFIPKIKIKKE